MHNIRTAGVSFIQSLTEIAIQVALRKLLQGGRGEAASVRFLGRGHMESSIHLGKYTANAKEQIGQVNDFSTFPMYGKMQELEVLEIHPKGCM